MIDHTQCEHANTKAERARCRRTRARQEHGVAEVKRPERVSKRPGKRLYKHDARPGLWIALRRPGSSLEHGYIVATDALDVWLNVGQEVERLSWRDVDLFLDQE